MGLCLGYFLCVLKGTTLAGLLFGLLPIRPNDREPKHPLCVTSGTFVVSVRASGKRDEDEQRAAEDRLRKPSPDTADLFLHGFSGRCTSSLGLCYPRALTLTYPPLQYPPSFAQQNRNHVCQQLLSSLSDDCTLQR